jgi:chromosome segregation ATPase
MDAEIADVESRIFQHQKRVENLQASGGDTVELQSAIASLGKALADLEAQKAELRRQLQSGSASR